jgi:bacterioferritin B
MTAGIETQTKELIMMISQKMNAAINRQIGAEFGAGLQYVAMAGHFQAESYPVLAGFFFKQGEEEREHAMRFVKYALDAGGRLEIPAVAAPKNQFKSAEEAVALALEWEQNVTRMINDLMALAIKESDYLTQNMLGWFINEQLEEVSTMENLLKIVKRAGEKNLFYVESYLAHQKGGG